MKDDIRTRIERAFNASRILYHMTAILAEKGLDALSDEAANDLAKRLIRSYRSEKRNNEKSRAIYAARKGIAA